MAAKSKMYAWRIDEEQLAALKKIKIRDGIPISEQLKRAIALWLKKK